MIRSKVKQFFDANDITIPKAFHDTKMSRSSLTRLYRNEVVNISLDTIDTICKTYGCTFQDLFEYVPDDDMTKEDLLHAAERRANVDYYTKMRNRNKAKKMEESE
jgi:DNA-binding Xre family transcriptional regulator